MNKQTLIAALAALSSLVSCKQTAEVSEMDQYVTDLMTRMTIEEKIGQLNLQVAGDIVTGSPQDASVLADIERGALGGVFNIKGADRIHYLQQLAVDKSRMGIPLLVGMDVIHGYETVFPIPLALSCSWDTLAVKDAARISAKEASADGINWVFSPMVDVALDQRWGRVAEGSGEDTYLASVMGAAMVRGYQGDLSKENVMACVKHFALYGAVESGREYNVVDMSRYRMYNRYFPSYKAALDAGAGSVMTSFNLVDGVPATANRWLLDDVMRQKWGYDGFVVTDYASISEMLQYRVARDMTDASVRALSAGTDMDMCSRGYVETLAQSLKDGKVTQKQIDDACRRVLEAKYKLGLFADPYRYCDTTRRATDIYTDENKKRAREIATETFVLLKNEKSLLPLSKTTKIALIGPLADTKNNMAGMWSVAATHDRYSSLRESMVRVVGKESLMYAQGCDLMADSVAQKDAEFGRHIARVPDPEAARREALQMAKAADVIVCAMGECAEMSGECASRTDLSLPSTQMELLRELVSLGKPIVLLNFSGRGTVLTWESEHVDAIMNVWFGGSEMGDAVCDVLFGDVAPSGRLTVSMPQNVGQLPLYYSCSPTGRPVAEGEKQFRKYASNYLDVRNDALYPFGYGLTYSKCEYSDVRIDCETMTDSAHVSVKVTNVGGRESVEVVQLYVASHCSQFARPKKELKRFARISIPAGESRDVTFTITPADLSYFDDQYRSTLEPGDYSILVGANSRDVRECILTVK